MFFIGGGQLMPRVARKSNGVSWGEWRAYDIAGFPEQH
jgi:hypothetical protein